MRGHHTIAVGVPSASAAPGRGCQIQLAWLTHGVAADRAGRLDSAYRRAGPMAWVGPAALSSVTTANSGSPIPRCTSAPPPSTPPVTDYGFRLTPDTWSIPPWHSRAGEVTPQLAVFPDLLLRHVAEQGELAQVAIKGGISPSKVWAGTAWRFFTELGSNAALDVGITFCSANRPVGRGLVSHSCHGVLTFRPVAAPSPGGRRTRRRTPLHFVLPLPPGRRSGPA